LLPVRVAHLVKKVLTAVPSEDANRYITDAPSVVTTEMGGQEIAAFVLAPSRRLPVIVEVLDFERRTPLLIAMGAGPLVGLVHVVQITTAEALHGFLSLTGYALVGPGCIVVNWAGNTEPEIVHRRELPSASENRERARLLQLIIDTAARSIAAPRVPAPPRRDDDLIESTSREITVTNETVDEDQAIHIEQLESTIDELEAALADADRRLAEQRAQLEQKGGQLDELILRNVSLEMQAGNTANTRAVASMTEALRLAREHCPFLVFHERAIESGEGLEGPEPVSVLQDLVRLNAVARAWMSGEITGTSIKLACRQMGLDFVPDISATARQKYEEDYLIDWRGKIVRAEAHLRRGKKSHLVRTHLYFDSETQQVVVAYIGRHLRDKGSSS
jgi:PII-like signaling protein